MSSGGDRFAGAANSFSAVNVPGPGAYEPDKAVKTAYAALAGKEHGVPLSMVRCSCAVGFAAADLFHLLLLLLLLPL